jgi:hypothetical protein
MRTLDRTAAIHEIRKELLKLVDDEHSIVAARHHVFCGGFAQWTFGELKRLYPQIVRSRPRLTPAELRGLANRWQLARQFARGTELACDTQVDETTHRTCQGWDTFTLEELAGFHASLCHEPVIVVADGEPAPDRQGASAAGS